MADDVLGKADSLMRRHRAFVAGEGTAAAAASTNAVSPAPTFAPAEADDLPVLTEVVGGSEAAPMPPAERLSDIEFLLRERLAAFQPRQRELLERELASWLDEQLPQLVMRVLDGVTDQLVGQINTQARIALLPRLLAALETDAAELSAAFPATPSDALRAD